MILLLIV